MRQSALPKAEDQSPHRQSPNEGFPHEQSSEHELQDVKSEPDSSDTVKAEPFSEDEPVGDSSFGVADIEPEGDTSLASDDGGDCDLGDSWAWDDGGDCDWDDGADWA